VNCFLPPPHHHHYLPTFLMALLLAGLMMPFTTAQAIDIPTFEPRVTTGIINYQYQEKYLSGGGNNVEWRDTSPFFGVGGTVSIATNFCERLFVDGYYQLTGVGDDRNFDPDAIPPRDENIDFNRRDLAGTIGCAIPYKMFLDGSVTLTTGYKAGKSEINGTHRRYPTGKVTFAPEDSTILKTDGVFGGVSLAWPIRATWQFQINLAYARLQSEFSSDYHGIIPLQGGPTTGTTGGLTGGVRLQNTLTRHITWSISMDYFNYDMDAEPPKKEKGVDKLGKVKERLVPLRASLIWRF